MLSEPEAEVARSLRKLIKAEANRRDLQKLLGLEVDPTLTSQQISLLEQLDRLEQAK
jgi:hypothetical protein